jgi:hypothetical protein
MFYYAVDLLTSSTPLTNTVMSQSSARIFSVLGILLVGIWTVSPLGGQASFRLICICTSMTTTPLVLDYMVSSSNGNGFWDVADRQAV